MPLARLLDGRTVDTDKLPKGVTTRYGRVFKPGFTKLQIEFVAFRDNWQPPFGLGRLGHFKRIVATVWPMYEWNDWSEEMGRALCIHDLVAFMGCAGSGKSRFLAMWALVNWWAAPQDTAIAVTSTDIEGAKGRVWGHLTTAHQEAHWLDNDGNRGEPPGKVTDQPPKVRLASTTDNVRGAGQQSIQLVAAGNANLDSALKTLQGLHNKFIILILDELQDLAPGIIGGVLENLTRNPRFQLCGAGNIDNPDDPLGTLCRPVTPENRGYDDVNENTHTWAIERAGKRGVCVRLDAECSPNFKRVELGLPEYTFLPQVWEVRAKKAALEKGEVDVTDYYRQWKAFIAPKNAEDGRYSPAAILKFQAQIMAEWATKDGFVSLGGVDPAYTSGGDRFILFPVHYGLVNSGHWVLEFQAPYSLQHDVSDSELRNYAMVRQTKRLCLDREFPIGPENVAVDTSGENPIGDIFAAEWSDQFLRVNFQGKASARPVSMVDNRPCHDEYGNKCSELWCVGAVFLRNLQLRGIDKQHEKELAARKIRRGVGNKLFAEKKDAMKQRTGFSPDIADGGNLALEVARERHGAVPGAENLATRLQGWQTVAQQTHVLPVRLGSNVGIASPRPWGRRR